MLVVLIPLAYVFLAVAEDVSSISLTLALHELALIPVAVFICSLSFAVSLSRDNLSLILPTV